MIKNIIRFNFLRSQKIITICLVLINISFFLYEIKTTGLIPILSGKESNISLIKSGANYAPLSLHHQPYRLIISLFLHASLLHIVTNMITLLVFGFALERRTNIFNYLIIYLTSGIIGNITSSLVNPHLVSVGASGAIFGVMAAITAYALFTPKKTQAYFPALFIFLLWNLLSGLSDPSIDILAHLGGLVSGFCLPLISIVLEHLRYFKK